MDRELQGKATLEILKSCDVIIAFGKQGSTGEVGRKLGSTLYSMGVKSEEAKILFEMVGKRIFANSDDTDFCVLACGEDKAEWEQDSE